MHPAGQPVSRWALGAEALFLLAVVAWAFFFYGGPHIWGAQYDDSYITYRYALNLAAGNGLVFNVGESADSASSFLYTVLLAAVAWLGAGAWLEVAGLAIGLLSIVFMAWRLFHIWRGWGLPVWAAVALGSGVMVNGFTSAWGLEGMETPFVAAVLLGAVEWLFLRRQAGWQGYALLLALALSRPEGLLPTLVYGLYVMPWRALATPRAWGTWGFWKELFARQRIGLAVLGTMLVFYVAKAWYYEGVWISQAYWLKRITQYYQPTPADVFKQWKNHLSLLWGTGVVGLLWAVWKPRTLTRPAAFCLLVLLALWAVLVAFGPREEFGRYGMPLVVLLAIGAGQGAQGLVQWPHKGKLLAAFLALLMLAQGVESARWYKRNLDRTRPLQLCRNTVAQQVAPVLPATMPVLSVDLGLIAYRLWPHPVVDMFGLTSRPVFDAVMQGQNKDTIVRPLGTAWIIDTVIAAPHQLYPYYTQADAGYTKPVAATQLQWHVAEPPMLSCQAMVNRTSVHIGVRAVRWSE